MCLCVATLQHVSMCCNIACHRHVTCVYVLQRVQEFLQAPDELDDLDQDADQE